MIAVIIAGGSGSRLWPLSTPDYPKHLLFVGEEKKTLLQKTYERAATIADDIYVVTDNSHAHHVQRQLPDIDEDHCIIEPGRRGNAHCILLALACLVDHDPDEPIAFLWADHYIRNVHGFTHSLQLAGSISQRLEKITLIGIEPTYPASSFGYIKKSSLVEGEDLVFFVDSFKEKPDRKTAERYLRSGLYLWNSGYHIASSKVLLKEMKTYAPELVTRYKHLLNAKSANERASYYLDLGVSDIGYALIEKVPDLLVVPATFDWMDLGSYEELHKANGADEQGNYTQGKNIKLQAVENSFIQNCEDKPIVVIGVDNIVVVNTKDGILVARKDLSQAVGDISKQLPEEFKSE